MKVVKCERADRRACRLAFILLPFVLLSVVMSAVFFYEEHSPGAGVLFLAIGASLAAICVRQSFYMRQARHAGRLWHRLEGGVGISAPWAILALDMLPIIILFAGSLTVLCVYMLGFDSYPGVGVFHPVLLSLVFLVVGIVAVCMTPINLSSLPDLMLTPEGLHVWPRSRHERWIAWEEWPEVLGVAGYGRVAIGRQRRFIDKVPRGTAPLMLASFRGLVAFYVKHPELRGELTSDAGLDRIRQLLARGVW